MSYNNGLYIFSEVPGYEASKGERIVKAFRKLRAKIDHLEQVRIVEKNTCSQKVQTSSDADLTITDVKYEILLIQLRYIIKIIREYSNDNQSRYAAGVDDMTAEDSNTGPSSRNLKCNYIKPRDVQHKYPTKNLLSASASVPPSEQRDLQQICVDNAQVTTEARLSENAKNSNAVDRNSKGQNIPNQKSKYHSHYHLKFDDVPFILGASSSASHSVVANVQNILALMKSHNKALCTPKFQNRKDAAAINLNVDETDTQAVNNKMMQELCEDLPKLTTKLKTMLDNEEPRPHPTGSKPKISHKPVGIKRTEKDALSSNPDVSGQYATAATLQKDSKQPMRKKYTGIASTFEKHAVPTRRIQSNNNPQFARLKMLRSLKDFKRHLSEEDLSWN